MTTQHVKLKHCCLDQRLDEMLELLDQLHSITSENAAELHLSQRELVAWLYEVIYTAQETVTELERNRQVKRSTLRLIERSSSVRTC
jgi:hypothetical protein